MHATTVIHPPGRFEEHVLTYVVIGARYRDHWIFVRHRERDTWEMPAGHIEPGERADRAAVRELFEEAGVVSSHLEHICDYAVTAGGVTDYGRLYTAKVLELEKTLEYEIAEITFVDELPSALTYPEVQGVLFERAVERMYLDS